MSLIPPKKDHFHVFLASPSDVDAERQAVRKFFIDYNHHTAQRWGVWFDVIDWENCASVGVGRPQDLITRQTLELHRDSLALVVGIMAQRFGFPTGVAESGTQEEFDWAMESHKTTGFPEIKWFFRKIDSLDGLPTDPVEAAKALDQWQKVLAFRQRMQDLDDPVFYAEYPSPEGFAERFAHDLNLWLVGSERPWFKERPAQHTAQAIPPTEAQSPEFDALGYQEALKRQFNTSDFIDALDDTGTHYSQVNMWSIFVPQSVRGCDQYNPQLLEIPKEHQQRLVETGELSMDEISRQEWERERRRRDYFRQPRRSVLDVVDETLGVGSSPGESRTVTNLVILGDPGSGKSSLIRYLAHRWSRITDPLARDRQPIPLIIELRAYGHWSCDGQKGFVRYLEQASYWYHWPLGLLEHLLGQSGRIVLLLDGLDEIFNLKDREAAVNDIQRFCGQFPQIPVIVTSRVVGYEPRRFRDAEFRHFLLQDLDEEQINAFVSRWHGETFDDAEQAALRRTRLQGAIKESKAIALLAGNPLLLTLMAIVNRDQELPRVRADLYAQASEFLLHKWDKKRLLANFLGISAEVCLKHKRDIVCRVAAHMQVAPGGLAGNMIDEDSLIELIERYLRDEIHVEPARARAMSEELVQQLRERNFALCFLGAKSYAFVHRTFLEYFCAADIIAKKPSEQALINLFDAHCRDDGWREVLRLICGQLKESAMVGRIVEHLVKRADVEHWNGKRPLPELILAIACVSELRQTIHLKPTGAALLKATKEVAKRVRLSPRDYEFMYVLLSVCQELGERWPGREGLEELGTQALESHDYVVEDEGEKGEDFWPPFIAAVWAKRSMVQPYAETTHGSEKGARYRRAAFKVLAEKWPDADTRELLIRRAIEDEDGFSRSEALEALAEHWPNDAIRELLTRCAVEDKHAYPRQSALEALAKHWPDEITHQLLLQRADQDEEDGPRRAAFEALAEKWPDQDTWNLLDRRALLERNFDPKHAALKALLKLRPSEETRQAITGLAYGVGELNDDFLRRAALRVLIEQWPDEATHDFVARLAVEHKDDAQRGDALKALANEWPDETTHGLLIERATRDPANYPRHASLEALAKRWPDEVSRDLVVQQTTEDPYRRNRVSALEILAKTWPDETTRQQLTAWAAEAPDVGFRSAAITRLAEHWPDESTRQRLTAWAIEVPIADLRATAVSSLAEQWPDEATFTLITRFAVDDGDENVRRAAIQSLAKWWRDDRVCELLTLRAVEDSHCGPRRDSLWALVRRWPNETTRRLLLRWADDSLHSDVRSNALEALAEYWPDDAARDLLIQRAGGDEDSGLRSNALEVLAEHWPDDATRNLLIQKAIEDVDRDLRSDMLRILIKHWTNQATRDFLIQRAIEDEDGDLRLDALRLLADHWPDSDIRERLTQIAMGDRDNGHHFSALRMLAEHWPDNTTRALLISTAIQDGSGYLRTTVLEILAEHWPDELTRELLTQKASRDTDEYARYGALKVLSKQWADQTTLGLLESQTHLFESRWIRGKIEELIAAIREAHEN